MDKPKRKRRTKKEMEAYRASLVSEPIPTIGVEPKKPPQVKFESEKGISDEGYIDASWNSFVEGWVTVNKAPKTRYAQEWYYCGGDIHETEEAAKKVTAPNRIAVAKIKFKVR